MGIGNQVCIPAIKGRHGDDGKRKTAKYKGR